MSTARLQTGGLWLSLLQPSYLPGGVLVTNCLLSHPENPSQTLPVVLHNESKHDIIIPAKSVIAEIHALQDVISNKQNPTDTTHSHTILKSPKNSGLDFHFGDFPLSAEWRARVKQKLSAMPRDVRSTLVKQTKHHIRLSNEMPFKHWPRP